MIFIDIFRQRKPVFQVKRERYNRLTNKYRMFILVMFCLAKKDNEAVH